jgi:hypothetical protein
MLCDWNLRGSTLVAFKAAVVMVKVSSWFCTSFLSFSKRGQSIAEAITGQETPWHLLYLGERIGVGELF